MTKNTNISLTSGLLENKKSFLMVCIFAASSVFTTSVMAKDNDLDDQEEIATHRKAVGATPQSSAITSGSYSSISTTSGSGGGGSFPGYVVSGSNFGYAGTGKTLGASPTDTLIISSAAAIPAAITSSAIDNAGFGYDVFKSITSGTQNVAVGSVAFNDATTASNNVAVGYSALGAVTTGTQNVGIGTNAGGAILTTSDSTAVGYQALLVNTGAQNTAVGSSALDANVAGTPNTAVGFNALGTNISGNDCTAVGAGALALSTGNNCTALGSGAGAVTTGTDNVFIGRNAGSTATTGINNIFIGSGAQPPVGVTDTATTVIGNGSTLRCYIRGIRGVTTVTADAINVLIDSNGNLGTVSSSRKFKENIVPMDQATAEKLAELNIVTFSYISDKTHKLQYGAIAEEVLNVFPDLVVYNKDGEIETIQYHNFIPLLIKYAQLQNFEVKALKAVVAALIARVEALENK